MKQTNVYFAMWLWLSVFGMVTHTLYNTHTHTLIDWRALFSLGSDELKRVLLPFIRKRWCTYDGRCLVQQKWMSFFDNDIKKLDNMMILYASMTKSESKRTYLWPNVWPLDTFGNDPSTLISVCLHNVWVECVFLAHLDAVVRGKPC